MASMDFDMPSARKAGKSVSLTKEDFALAKELAEKHFSKKL